MNPTTHHDPSECLQRCNECFTFQKDIFLTLTSEDKLFNHGSPPEKYERENHLRSYLSAYGANVVYDCIEELWYYIEPIFMVDSRPCLIALKGRDARIRICAKCAKWYLDLYKDNYT